MTKDERLLEHELDSLAGKIISAGQYIDVTCEGIPGEGIVTYNDGVVITDPVGKADEIIKTANEIKKLAIQYQALLNLEAKVSRQNKKATNNSQDPTQVVVND